MCERMSVSVMSVCVYLLFCQCFFPPLPVCVCIYMRERVSECVCVCLYVCVYPFIFLSVLFSLFVSFFFFLCLLYLSVVCSSSGLL